MPPNEEPLHAHAQSRDMHETNTVGNGSSGGNRFTFNFGGATLVVVLLLSLIIGACGLVMGLNLAKQDQMDRDYRDLTTAYKLEERRKIDLETYLMVNGFKRPGDDMHGPTGNLERMQPKETSHGRQ